jgi:K+-sensing histidine kinase KdpD
MLIRRGRRVADYLGCPCTAVYSKKEAAAMEPWLNFCVNLRIRASAIDCDNPPKNVADYARGQRATQVFVTRDNPDAARLVDQARDMQVTVVAQRVRAG